MLSLCENHSLCLTGAFLPSINLILAQNLVLGVWIGDESLKVQSPGFKAMKRRRLLQKKWHIPPWLNIAKSIAVDKTYPQKAEWLQKTL